MTRALLSLAVLLLSLTTAHATTYTVSPTGSDSNPGTEAQPFATIQRGADVAMPGDTVMVLPGTYTQPVTASRSGTATARIRYVSQVRGRAQIRLAGRVAWTIDGDYISVEGFEIIGLGGVAVPGVPGQGGIFAYGSHIEIRYNIIHELRAHECSEGPLLGASAILAGIFARPAEDITVNCNTVYNNGGGAAQACVSGGRGPHGIYHVHSGLVAGNIVYNNRGAGIQAWHAPHDLVIRENLSYGNGISGIIVGGSEAAARNIQVLNNVVRDNYGRGIFESGGNTPTNQFRNNILWHNQSGDIELNTSSDEGTVIADRASPPEANCAATGVDEAGLDGPGITDAERTALLTRATAQARATIAAQQRTLPRSLTPVMPTFPSLPGRPGT